MTTLEPITVLQPTRRARWEHLPTQSWVERHPRSAMALLMAAFVAAWLLEAARRPLWFDELLTFYTTQQSTAREVIHAIEEGCDGSAPLYALLVRALQPLLGSGPVALRLPSLIGYGVMCLSVFAFARRRLPLLYATLAMLITCDAAWPYATEGRPYGLVLGCTGVALLCWQAASEGRPRALALPGLAASLSLGVAFHYYAVFLLVPIFAGELAKWHSRRKLDWPVLAALAIPPLVLIPHLPLIRAARTFVPHFWAKAFPIDLSDFYFLFFGDALRGWIPAALVAYVVWRLLSGPEPATPTLYRHPPMAERERLVCGALAIFPVFYLMFTGALEAFWISVVVGVYAGWRFLSRREPPTVVSAPTLMPSHEWAACGALASLPVFILALAYSTVGIFVPRYVLPAVIGVGLVAAATAFRALRGSRMAGASLVIGLLVGMGARTTERVLTPPPPRDGEMVHKLVVNAPPDPAPILIANPLAYLELWFYAEPKLRDRLVYTVDPDLERRYLGIDTNSLILSALQHRIPIRTLDRGVFVATHRRFILAVTPGYEYMASHLRRSGFLVTLLEKYKNSRIYRVEAPVSSDSRATPLSTRLNGRPDGD